MRDKTRIAVVGYGFVGKAVVFGFRNSLNEILVVDPKEGYSSIDDLKYFKPDFTFVCVPTPMNDKGSIDSRTISAVVKELRQVEPGIVIIKSTVTPDVVKDICNHKHFVYNPEFLTERNSFDEFINPKFHILGGSSKSTKKVNKLYKFNSNCNPAPAYYMTAVEASLVKYGINSFLATKVVWFNQWKELVELEGARYNVVSSAMTSDKRVGSSHTAVPGFDGKKGFGGSCLPKDTSAIWNYCIDEHSSKILSLVGETIRKNNKYRSEYELDEREKKQNIKYRGD